MFQGSFSLIVQSYISRREYMCLSYDCEKYFKSGLFQEVIFAIVLGFLKESILTIMMLPSGHQVQ